ncbi:MAG: cytochrome c3 family protein [Planctomycetes bacterium]|nr:cytochrome c3 family protein [Planctomycetota bacterium]MCB9910583.1 cytochrome c3 family protein [Planctomycetota bacterium]MCB9913202.1 cytochrome c3 family protein [Planctomycetota bacterium]HPF15046.1 cytochrome c3 family protein [Planctomycetota bacterium]HRV83148.1 cytochrome c3 family protein [Planctomycetota bacterium]
MDLFHFPRWVNRIRLLLPPMFVMGGLYAVGLVNFGASPDSLVVGYAPKQPIPYSHRLHAGELGIDCRYCHQNVDKSAHASLPASATCMNCHTKIRSESPKLALLRETFAADQPIPWVKVHDLPDYVYFDHSAHVTKGIGCVECHGRVDQMEVVTVVKKLSMGWCLDCHRNPQPALRPVDQVTNMAWTPPEGGVDPALLRTVHPKTNCSTCHR